MTNTLKNLNIYVLAFLVGLLSAALYVEHDRSQLAQANTESVLLLAQLQNQLLRDQAQELSLQRELKAQQDITIALMESVIDLQTEDIVYYENLLSRPIPYSVPINPNYDAPEIVYASRNAPRVASTAPTGEIYHIDLTDTPRPKKKLFGIFKRK